MQTMLHVGLIGDRDDAVTAHRAIPVALRLAEEALSAPLSFEWVPTEEVADASRVARYDALWCVPASPYRSMDGALRAIRFAREQRRPFLGTCGGFQHAVVEYARHVLGWSDAEHAETAPEAQRAVIAPLACSLVEATGKIRFNAGTRIARAYGRPEATEGYRCRYGLNPEFQAALVSGPLRIGAEDDAGDVRAVELDGHPFFVATLFQPERAALAGRLPPLVAELIRACSSAAG
ncbi:CTP synthase [Sorangium sp. So ce302]|uniref:CTP synthase C-terminal region-related (seleno)protein n=1 Tax=Sorangium sp. So ce302 TaxID=3133297 RepID=UPI003F60B4CB